MIAFMSSEMEWGRRIEGLIVLGLTGVCGGCTFFEWGDGITLPVAHSVLEHATQSSLLYLLLVWAAVRHGLAATVKVILLVAVVAVTASLLGKGPYAGEQAPLVMFISGYVLVGVAMATYAEKSRKLTLALRTKEEFASRSLENYIAALNAHAIVSATDASGRIVAINDKFCEISGYDKDELIGQDHRLLNSGYHPHAFFCEMYQRLSEGRPWHGEIRNRAKDGHHYWVKSTIVRFNSNEHEPIHFISIRTDITEQKETALELDRISSDLAASYRKLDAENQYLQKLKAESDRMQRQLLQSEKLAAIGHLAAGLAHEINNPIGFVNSNLGTLKRYLDTLTPLVDLGASTPAGQVVAVEVDLDYIRGDIRALVDESRGGIDRVRKIVAALKDFSHVGEVEWQRTDILSGLRNAIDVAAHEIKKTAQIIDELTPLPSLQCVPSQVNQVFLNLLVNAAQAIENSGTITLRSGVDAAGMVVWVEIIDTGCGMDEVTQQHLFDPFFTTKPVGTGTGLGLTMSWDIVQQHGGSIDVISTPGRGSCFRVSLPIHDQAGKGNQP
jgi:two-component system NtrC family sensor kinase